MIKVTSFVICDAIQNLQTQGGDVPQLTAPLLALRPPFIPGAISFGLSMGVAGISFKEPARIQFTITSPEGRIVQDSGVAEFSLPPIVDTIPEQYQGFMLSTDIRNLEVPSEGVYRFTLYVNGEVIETREIPIFKRFDKQ